MGQHSGSRGLRKLSLALILIGTGWAATADGPSFVFEAYPPDVLASKQLYQRHVALAGATMKYVPFYIIVPKLQRWVPGQVVRVAFNGGDNVLYEKIASVANRWVLEAGINLKLRFNDASGRYMSWTQNDAVYAAEIRIGFLTDARGGNWSHLGTDSINPNLVGGSPGQASMNLQGFDRQLPYAWESTTLHEFGHALGFEHEHQNPAAGCDFRFEDDPGYRPTTDEEGWYKPDEAGRNPGLYTYLGGFANRWPREKVDANLKALPVSSAYLMGEFDNKSIMKYQFPAFGFRSGESSPCYTPMDTAQLSTGDVAGARRAYPHDADMVGKQIEERRTLLNQLLRAPSAAPGIRSHVSSQLKSIAY